jgi:MTH538 TIR-like domain (DUF1863)
MFRRKRGDTLVRTLEKKYSVDLGVRGDMKVSNLLARRGADSVTKLVKEATRTAATHRVFLSFDYDDLRQVQGFRLLRYNANVEVDLYDGSLRAPINSENASYIKTKIHAKIARSSVTVCLIGARTYASDWVDWEIRKSVALRKGLLGIRLKGCKGDGPRALREFRVKIIDWAPDRFQEEIKRVAVNR